jgi:hypothetical protein
VKPHGLQDVALILAEASNLDSCIAGMRVFEAPHLESEPHPLAFSAS